MFTQFLTGLFLLIAGSAISIPVPGISVPVTLQTLALHLNAGHLHPQVSIAVISIYVFGGMILQIPWFAAPPTAKTSGYLLAFVWLTIVESVLKLPGFWASVAFCGACDFLLLVQGAVVYRLLQPTGQETPIQKLIVPFIMPDLVKCILAQTFVHLLSRQ